jgi:hypothetical protein
MQQLGKRRGVGFVIVLAIVTFGIYTLYWFYASFAEVKRRRGQGVGGFVGLLLALIPVSIFLLPSYVGRMYKENGEPAPITGWSGLLNLIPFIGGLIWLARVQGTLNRFWEGQQPRTAPDAPPVGV